MSISINLLCPVSELQFTFALVLAQPSPGVVHLAPEVYPALPDDVVPGAGQLVQVPWTVAEDGVENVLVR